MRVGVGGRVIYPRQDEIHTVGHTETIRIATHGDSELGREAFSGWPNGDVSSACDLIS